MSELADPDEADISAPTGVEMLLFYPKALRRDLIEDDAFRASIGVEVATTLTIDSDIIFDREPFLEMVRTLHGGDASAQLTDETGSCWDVSIAQNGDGVGLWLKKGERQIVMPPLLVLHPKPQMRLAEWASSLDDAGLPPDAHPEWRATLETRPLDDDEILAYEKLFLTTPVAFLKRLPRTLARRGNIATEELVPDNRAYYEQLCGGTVAASIEQLMGELLPAHVSRMLAWRPDEGAQIALALSARAPIVPAGPLPDLPTEIIEGLLRWAIDSGDPWSKIGALDLGIAVVARTGAIEPLLVQLFEQVRDFDPENEVGPLYLLMGALIVTAGELARTRVIADWPPFQRRLAVFAHAALLVRILQANPPHSDFANWASETRTRHFYYQGAVDLQREPRWHPEGIAPSNLKAEFLGRIQNAATREGVSIPPGQLRDLLLGTGSDSLSAHIVFPGSFNPGPLEGGDTETPGEMPAGFAEILDGALADEEFTPTSVIGLINLKGLFPLSPERVERAVNLMRQNGHRFAAETDPSDRETLFMGLAGVAAVTRSPELSAELRTMVRKNRIDGKSPPEVRRELLICLTAAGAYRDRAAWADFVGSWSVELAFSLTDKALADGLLDDFYLLCAIAPELRRFLSPAIAAAAGLAAAP